MVAYSKNGDILPKKELAQLWFYPFALTKRSVNTHFLCHSWTKNHTVKPHRHSSASCSTLKCTEQKPARKASLCCHFRVLLDQIKHVNQHMHMLYNIRPTMKHYSTTYLQHSSNVGEAHAFAILIHNSIKILIYLLQLHEFGRKLKLKSRNVNTISHVTQKLLPAVRQLELLFCSTIIKTMVHCSTQYIVIVPTPQAIAATEYF